MSIGLGYKADRRSTSRFVFSLGSGAISSSSKNQPIVIILYLDGLVIEGEDLVDINKVKFLLSSKFEMTDMTVLHYFLGIEVIRTPTGLLISNVTTSLTCYTSTGRFNVNMWQPLSIETSNWMPTHASQNVS